MTLRLVIMGCGSSGGVPRLGPNWGACDPANPKNRRRRAAVLIERVTDAGRTTVLIDTSPDIREQLIEEKVRWIDGVVFTHDHADHTHGIDDLRMIAFNGRRRVECYADAETYRSLVTRFGYCFEAPPTSSYPPILEARALVPGELLTIEGKGGPIEIMPFLQLHGDSRSIGFRVGNVAYSSDASDFPDSTVPYLRGLDVWIIGALRYIPHPSHFTVKQALSWIKRMAPRRAVLTHLHIDLDYDALARELPKSVEPAFDGMSFEIAE